MVLVGVHSRAVMIHLEYVRIFAQKTYADYDRFHEPAEFSEDATTPTHVHLILSFLQPSETTQAVVGSMHLMIPHAIAISPKDGNLYVADRQNSRVVVLKTDGVCVCVCVCGRFCASEARLP